MTTAPNQVSQLCLDPSKPVEVRAKILLDVLQSNDEVETRQALLTDLLRKSAAAPEAEVARLKEAYQEALAELELGAVRPATFLAMAQADFPTVGPRAHVVTPDGQERYPTLHPRVQPADLHVGMVVYLDPKGSTVLGRSLDLPRVGQQGAFLRRIEGSTLIEADLQHERLILYPAKPVLDALAAGALRPGDRLLVCPRRYVALSVVPGETDHRDRFIDRERVPEVLPERDIGQPHWILDYLLRRLRLLLFQPDLFARFDLRPRCGVLLTGPSGCGKTLTIRAVLHAFGRMLVERTGRQDLGSRVVRVKLADLLSEWLGRTDKNVEALFNDVRAVAGAEVETARGERLRLPVVLVLEEVEGMARRRGGHEALVYDRILATLLQRLDDPSDDLARLPLLLLSTSNRPDLIDAAMCRRLGTQARFTRLDRAGLTAILEKKLKPHYPYAPLDQPAAEARAAVIDETVRGFFGPGPGNAGAVEVALRGGKKIIKRRRDFLTGSLVEQAVATALDRVVCAAAEPNAGEPALTAAAVREGARQHIDALLDQLTADNAADYLDLPANGQVTTVRRLGEAADLLPPLLTDLDN